LVSPPPPPHAIPSTAGDDGWLSRDLGG
jgi:hypothetical protein